MIILKDWDYSFTNSLLTAWINMIILFDLRCADLRWFVLLTLSSFKSQAIRIISVNICLLTVCVKYFNFFYPYLLIFWVSCSKKRRNYLRNCSMVDLGFFWWSIYYLIQGLRDFWTLSANPWVTHNSTRWFIRDCMNEGISSTRCSSTSDTY